MKKIVSVLAGFAVLVVGGVALAGCGNANKVSFDKYSGSYTHVREVEGEPTEVTDRYTVAGTKWTRQADEEGYTEVYKMDAQTLAYDEATTTALEFTSDVNGSRHFVVMKFRLDDADEEKTSVYLAKIDGEGEVGAFSHLASPEDEEVKNNSFVLVMGIHENTVPFVVAFDFDGEGEYEETYKFVVDMNDITLAPQEA